MRGLDWLAKDARPGDVLFFHFSGHGAQEEDPHGYEEDGMNETILPVDFQRAGMISDDAIAEKIVHNLPEGVRLTALMDSCHSGSGLDLPFVWQPQGRGFHQRGGGSWLRAFSAPISSAHCGSTNCSCARAVSISVFETF